ncbi:MAG: RcnB family protein [Acidobacteria bacterium]|nr:RcnB family protein [Acidobacteriota bacterium]
MKPVRRIAVFGSVLLVLASMTTFAKDHDRDEHGHGHGKHKGNSEVEFRYSDRDHEALRGWYKGHRGDIPPGLAKRDELPPGLEKQLVRRGTLPPGLRKKMYDCPPEVVRFLPPPPPDCRHVFIGGHIVLVNRRTNVVLDFFRF